MCLVNWRPAMVRRARLLGAHVMKARIQQEAEHEMPELVILWTRELPQRALVKN